MNDINATGQLCDKPDDLLVNRPLEHVLGVLQEINAPESPEIFKR